MKNTLTLSLMALLISGCQSNANFKSANVIKPHLDAALIEEPAIAPKMADVAMQRFVYFDFDSAILTPVSQQVLDTHLTAMKAITTGQIVLQGHTDQVGSEKFNFELGKQRATSVYVYLVNSGVAAERLSLSTMGEGDSERKNVNPKTDRHVEIIY